MEVREKLILSGLILATGVSGTLWFRKTGAALDPPQSPLASHSVRREEYRPSPVPSGDHRGAAPAPVPLRNAPAPSVNRAAPATDTRPVDTSLPPKFAADFQPVFDKPLGQRSDARGATLPPAPLTGASPIAGTSRLDQPPMKPVTDFGILVNANARPATAPPADPFRNPTAPSGPAASPFSMPAVSAPVAAPLPTVGRRHKIADGDTLAMLAAHYLGNASRRLEIFQANRTILRDPDVLPIGAEIVIPTGPSPWDR